MKAFIKMARRAGLSFRSFACSFYELAAVPIASLFIAAKPESAIGLETLALGLSSYVSAVWPRPLPSLISTSPFPSKPWETAE